MKEDDLFVTQGMARDRRTTYHRGSLPEAREMQPRDSNQSEAKITEVYSEIL